MELFTSEQAARWCAARRLTFSQAIPDSFRLSLPNEAHRLPYLLVNLLDAKVDDNDEIRGAEHLLWITSWDIWPHLATSIGLAHFDALRRGLGASTDLSTAPAALFAGTEIKELVCCALTPLVFGWDCLIIPSSADYFVRLDHDRFVEVVAKDAQIKSRMMFELRDWGPSL